MHLELTAIVVDDQDEAIAFFVDVLGFELVTDEPSTTNDGRPKRWVVVRPPGATTGLLLARAHGERQRAVVGDQFAGRVGHFLRVDDFDATHRRLLEAGVEVIGQPRQEPYGQLVVFVDVAGNRWDLLGPIEAGDGGVVGEPRVTIRRERRDDEAGARLVQAAAFADGDGDGEATEPAEARLLDGLRQCDGWLPALSWVADIGGDVVGHNVATRGSVGDVACVGLGPIGIAPDRQHQGIGSRLMWALIGAADATGEPLIALLGNPDYYRRFGFEPSTEFGVDPPDPNWGRYFQVRPLSAWSPSIRGTFRYAAPFDELG